MGLGQKRWCGEAQYWPSPITKGIGVHALLGILRPSAANQGLALHVHAAVDGENVSRDVSRFFAAEKFDGVGYVVRLADAAERHLGQDRGLGVLRQHAR